MIYHLNDEQFNVFCLGDILENYVLTMNLPSDVRQLVSQLNDLCGHYMDSYPADEEAEEGVCK